MPIIQELVDQLTNLVRETRGWGVFWGVMAESIIVPIPSPLVIMAAGFFLIPPEASLFEAFSINLFDITLPGAFGATVGSLLCYFLGYWGGKPAIDRLEKFLGTGWQDVLRFESFLEKNNKDELIIFLGRALPIVPLSLVSLGAGVLQMKKKRFFAFTFLGALPRCFALGILGWVMGATYHQLAGFLENLETATFIMLVLAVLAYFFVKKKRDSWLSRIN